MTWNVWNVHEYKMRADGDVDVVTTTKYSFATALSLYYSKLSAYCVDTTYPKVGVALTDAEGAQIKYEVVDTQYNNEQN